MMSVYGDDEHEIEDEETLDLPPKDEHIIGEDGMIRYYLGGPFGPYERDPS